MNYYKYIAYTMGLSFGLLILSLFLMFNKVEPIGSIFYFLSMIGLTAGLIGAIINANYGFGYSLNSNHDHYHEHVHTHSHQHTHNHFNYNKITEGYETTRDMPDGSLVTTRHVKRWE